jgi:hypothetical protein
MGELILYAVRKESTVVDETRSSEVLGTSDLRFNHSKFHWLGCRGEHRLFFHDHGETRRRGKNRTCIRSGPGDLLCFKKELIHGFGDVAFMNSCKKAELIFVLISRDSYEHGICPQWAVGAAVRFRNAVGSEA